MADEAPKESVPESVPEVKEEPPKEENVESEKQVEQVTQKLETVSEEKVEEKSTEAKDAVKEEPPKSSNLEKATSIEKPTKSKKSSKKDHADDGNADMGDMGTLFILDLMKQRKEKMMRKKKDDMINELAMKKKQQIMEARMGKRVLTRPSFGGFVGVGAILAGSQQTSPATRRRTPKPRDVEPNVDIPPPERTDLLIMGILRDKKEQKFHEAHEVYSPQAAVPSDEKWMAKFGD